MGQCRGCLDFPWMCLGTWLELQCPALRPGGRLQGPAPPWQGKPPLAISREAPPRIQNKGKLLAGGFPGMAPDHKLLLGPRSPAHGSVQGVPGLPMDVLGDMVGAPVPCSAAWREAPGSCTSLAGKASARH